MNDFFFLLNLVLFYSLAEIQRLSYLGSFESKLKGMLNTFLHLDLHNELGGLLAFYSVVLFGAGVLFLLLRFVPTSNVLARIPYYCAGIVALSSLPSFLLWEASKYDTSLHVPSAFVWAELLVALICASLFMTSYLRAPSLLILTLTILHFGFWSWLFLDGPYFWRQPSKLVFPFVSLVSTLIWVKYLQASSAKQVRRHTEVTA